MLVGLFARAACSLVGRRESRLTKYFIWEAQICDLQTKRSSKFWFD